MTNDRTIEKVLGGEDEVGERLQRNAGMGNRDVYLTMAKGAEKEVGEGESFLTSINQEMSIRARPG